MYVCFEVCMYVMSVCEFACTYKRVDVCMRFMPEVYMQVYMLLHIHGASMQKHYVWAYRRFLTACDTYVKLLNVLHCVENEYLKLSELSGKGLSHTLELESAVRHAHGAKQSTIVCVLRVPVCTQIALSSSTSDAHQTKP